MADFLSRRDVDFLLYEWLDVVELTKRDHFAEHSRDTFDAVLDLSADIATKCFAPHNKKGDQSGPSVGPDGKVVLIDEGTFVNAFFPAVPTDTTTPIGAAENAGDIRTKDISTFLFPNAYLYQGTPTNCCVLGFHTYDIEPGSASNGWRERRYVLNYASWITPGLF